MRTRAHDAELATLDVPYLSNTYDVSESNFQSLLDAPTVELIKDFLTSLTTKAREYDSLKADKVKVDVELESTVRTSEAKVKAQKAAVTRYAKEAEELRSQLQEAKNANETLSHKLEQIRSSTSGSTAETQTLRQRIESLEASNRDTLALVESKSSEKDRLATELSEQHGKLLSLRRDISGLEERNQALDNAASSQRFKEQSLQQEIDLLKRNNEWHATELQTRGQENAKFRKERNARMAGLQRELEDSSSNVETLKRTETTLRQRLEELQGKADEAFARIATLQEDSTRQEQGWKAELESSKRLAQLQAQNAATHKARLQEIQGQVEQVRENASNEIGQLQSEVETERSFKNEAEAKVAELELKVERLEQQPRASRPGTPMNNGSFDPSTPGRVGSPFAVSSIARKFGGKLPFTNTEFVAKFNEMQQDLEAERRRTQKLCNAMDEMLADAENRGPELLELREDQQRLEEEVLNFSRLLENANTSRDEALSDVQRWESEAESRSREVDVLRQQLRDLSAQIKILLVEMQSTAQGLEEMSAQERFQLEQAARGELEEWSQSETFTNQLISQRLVIYRTVEELQKTNEDQLRMLRFQAEQLEGEEARKKAEESQANAQEAEELRQQVSRYKDELQATAVQIDSYIKERDMFRRMLHHRGQLDPDADLQALFGQSVPPATPARNGVDNVPQTPRSKDIDDMQRLLREQQSFFDQFRNESGQDRQVLKDQADSLSRDKSALQADLAHWKSQKTLSDERLQMLQANYDGLRGENVELQKRSREMAEAAAKQDLRTQQVAEDLVEARSMSESLRNENANAKAEKELWKRIEARLSEDNKGLMDERSRLNKLVADLQSLQNQRELSDSEARRKLQDRVESFESEIADTKKKLEQALEDSRKANLRREYDEGQSRTRIDDLVKSLGNIREELVAAKTTRDQLQSRVDELKVELRSAEERATALQPRPTPRAEPQQNGDDTHGDEDNLSAEQRSALELSDLRRDLEFARNELDSMRQQVEQYKSIAQASEEELANFNETSEQYKDETDRQITAKDAHAKTLQQRIDDLSNELSTSNNELSDLRNKQDDSSRVLNDLKSTYEAEIHRLKDDAERYSEEKKLYQADLKAQAGIAQQAQQSYEDELLKHADAARSLQSLRSEHNSLRMEVAGIRAEAEVARVSLERGEESWSEQRDRFEKELDELKQRRQDADGQNRLLHQQIESFSSELAALRLGRNVPTDENGTGDGTPSGDNNMREVVKYLRREKEIVDVQYELSMQESKRLQQQLDYANTQLEELRLKLVQERRQSSDKLASEGSTSKLMQTINELNLFRESSITLRNEARQARERLEARTSEVERLLSDIGPLNGRVSELEGELESKDGELRLLQDDRDHWRERTQNIISRYDRVDPAEIEEMKKQLEELTAEKARLEAEQAPLQEQIEGIETKVTEAVEDNTKTWEGRLEKFKNQAKEQNRKQVARIKDNETALEIANQEKAKAVDDLAKAQQELEEMKTSLQEAQSKTAGLSSADTQEGQVTDSTGAGDSKVAEVEARAAELATRLEESNVNVERLQARVGELSTQVESLQQQLKVARDSEEGEIQSGTADSELLEKLRTDLATAQQEVETLRVNVSQSSGTQNVSTGDSTSDETIIATRVAEEVDRLRAEMQQQHELAKKQLEEQRDSRIEGMKKTLNDRLRETRQKIREELMQAHSTELQKLKEEHDTAIARLKADHQAELARLTIEGQAAVQEATTPSPKIKDETAATVTPDSSTAEQLIERIKTDPRMKGFFNQNVNARVASEMKKLREGNAGKNAEIEHPKQAPSSTSEDGLVAELRGRISTAEAEKKKAVAQAIEQLTKKAQVQINMLGNAQAKISVVKKAADETPEKPVKEVWEVALKAKPPPKPAAAPSSSSPATAPAQPIVSAPPSQAPGPASTETSVQGSSEEEKLQQRQQRFGTVSASTPPSQAAGRPSDQPNVPSSAPQPAASAVTGQTGPANLTGALNKPARRLSTAVPTAPNPQAPAFNPATGNNGRPSPSGNQRQLSGAQPSRIGGPAGRGGNVSNTTPTSFVGAAANPQSQQNNPAARGGASGIPRGGAIRGARGGIPRGGTNAGQKRQNDTQEGGDEKRQRGSSAGP